MKFSFVLRQKLAELYPLASDLRRFGSDVGLDMTYVDLTGDPLDCWRTVLELAKVNRRLPSLLNRIAEESQEFESLLRQLSNDQNEEESNPESAVRASDLTCVVMHESEQRDLAALMVAAMRKLPNALVQVVLSSAPPRSTGGVHSRKAKAELDDYQRKCNEYERDLDASISRYRSRCNEIELKIQRLKSKPIPQKPPDPSGWLNQRQWSEEFRRNKYEEYRRDNEEYEKKRLESLSDKDEINSLEKELNECKSSLKRDQGSLSEFRVRKVTEVARLEDRVSNAEKEDQLEFLERLLSEAGKLQMGYKGFEAFTRFLLAAAVNAKCQNLKDEIPASLLGSFERTREVNALPFLDKPDEVLKPILGALGFVLNNLGFNTKQMSGAIDGEEDHSSRFLVTLLEAYGRLQNSPIPEVPTYQHLVSIPDLTRAERLVNLRMLELAYDLRAIELEIGDADFNAIASGEEVKAENDTRQKFSNRIEVSLDAVAREIKLLFDLVVIARPMLGGIVYHFCDSIWDEVERRIGIGAGEIADLFRKRDGLKLKLEAGRKRFAELQTVAELIRKKPEAERDQFLQKCAWLEWMALIPIVNLFNTVSISSEIDRLREAFNGGHPAYREMSSKGLVKIATAIIVVTIVGCFVCLPLIVRNSLTSSDLPNLFLFTLTGQYLFYLIRMIANWCKLYSFSKYDAVANSKA
jgi:hypothetical protein